MSRKLLFFAGAAVALGARTLFVRALLFKMRSDVSRLNDGDYEPLLRGYADDAVLSFTSGAHRWAGEHRGKEQLQRFLENYTAAHLQGEISGVMFSGPPWALTMMARFDDHANDASGTEIYSNRVVVRVETRWGKIVRHDDFYEHTGRIEEFDKKLTMMGIEPVGASD